MKMIKLHKGNGTPQKIDLKKLCLNFIKSNFIGMAIEKKEDVTPKKYISKNKINHENIPQPTRKGSVGVDRG